MKTVQALGGTWTEERFSKLKSAYDGAINERKQVFIFEEQDMDLGFSKYLIEYLETQFKNDKKND